MTEPIIAHIGRFVAALQQTITSARGSGRQGRATLVDLNNQTCGTAAVLNKALDGWHVRNEQDTARHAPKWMN